MNKNFNMQAKRSFKTPAMQHKHSITNKRLKMKHITMQKKKTELDFKKIYFLNFDSKKKDFEKQPLEFSLPVFFTKRLQSRQ